jgi:hypothetical protein
MTHTANPSVPQPGIFRRALAGFWAFLEALESGGSGYTFDRIERLERAVGRLQEELRQSRDPGAADVHNTSAAGLEH